MALGLSASGRDELPQMLKAFIARSFSPTDEERLRPILGFLDTFKSVGFVCQSAEAAEVESVSAKVRRLIDESDVFIGFFTRRYPVYDFSLGVRAALKVVRGALAPKVWSAPAWVLQESGYALQRLGERRLILLREPDVEVFGLQGDLEYIPFVPERSSEVQSKLNEMILGLVAEAAGTEVKIVVSQREEERVLATVAAPEAQIELPNVEAPKGDEIGQPQLTDHFLAMFDASESRDLGKLSQAWNAGMELIELGKAKDIDRVAWDCYYQECRFEAGVADGLDALRYLQKENPARFEPVSTVARCLYRSKEYEESAVLYLKAAELSDSKAPYFVSAARAFNELKRYAEGIDAAHSALSRAAGETKEEALRVLYRLMRESGETFFAYAVAESALHENPRLNVRFTVALEYQRDEINTLALHHFKFLFDNDQNDSSSLHNLALVCADSKLPILSVGRYKEAFDKGETLSAANLGYMYLDCGMHEEANAVIQNAMRLEGHDARVEKCLAEIIQRKQNEQAKETDLLSTAAQERELFIQMGNALLRPAPTIDGLWRFPFGDIPLLLAAGVVSGSTQIKSSVESGWGALLGEPAARVEKINEHTLKAKLSGSVCKFEHTVIDVTERSRPAAQIFSSILTPTPTSSWGFIIFSSNGESALYIELKEGKLGKHQSIARVK